MTTLAVDAAATVMRALTSGRQLYLACHIGTPDRRGSLECVGRPYERLPVRLVERDGVWGNVEELRYLMPGTVVRALGLWDAPRGGRFVIGEATDEMELALGDTYIVPAGSVRLRVAGKGED